MRRTFIYLVALLLVLGACLLKTQPLYACSWSEDFDPVAEAELVVGGRVISWQRLPADANAPFVPVRVTLVVAQSWKGEAGPTVSFIDRTSLASGSAQELWVGSGGACGVFDAEPTGQYLVLGLDREPNGTYRASLPLRFFGGAEPAGPVYEQAVARLDALAQQSTPTTDVLPTSPSSPTSLPPSAAATPTPDTPAFTPQPSLVADAQTAAPAATPAPSGANGATPPTALALWLLGGLALGALSLVALRQRRQRR